MLRTLRLGMVFPYCVAVFFGGTLFSMLRPFHPNNLYFTSKFLKHGAKILGIEFDVEGLEHLESDRPAVIISNHQNNFDMLVATQLIPKRTVSLGKQSIIFIPFFGIFYWLTGNILIKRGHHSKAMKTMKYIREKIISKNLKVWILPEGHRSWGRGLLPFKKGAFHTAIQTQVPIIPICFSDYSSGKIKLNKWKSAKIKIKVLPPISTSGMTTEDVKPLLASCHGLMSENISTH